MGRPSPFMIPALFNEVQRDGPVIDPVPTRLYRLPEPPDDVLADIRQGFGGIDEAPDLQRAGVVLRTAAVGGRRSPQASCRAGRRRGRRGLGIALHPIDLLARSRHLAAEAAAFRGAPWIPLGMFSAYSPRT